MAGPKGKPARKIRILGHPGHPTPDAAAKKAGVASGVQTSEGDKFHGDIVELPGDEADLLVGMGRAEETEKEKKAAE